MGSNTSSESRVAAATAAAAPPSVPIKLQDAPAAAATAAAPSIPQGRKEEIVPRPPDPVPMTSVRIHAETCSSCTGAGECDCGADLAISKHSFVLESKTALKANKNECVRRSAHVAMARNTSAVIGSGDACNIQIDDESLLQKHVQLKSGDDGSIHVQPAVSGAKCFVQLGQGSERAAPHILENAQKIKAGALTFQVCALVKSWESITEGARGSSAAQTVSDVSSQSTGLDKGAAATGVVHVSANAKSAKADPDADADDDAELVECNRCFICYESASGPGLEALIQSPCLCKTMFVHRMCLNQWLEHSPNGRCCMTCKTAFPFGVGVEPPFVVLRITRHMKNLVWKGPKQFVIALRNNEVFTFGSSSTARVQFRDPSVSSRHGQFVYRNNTLYIEDLGSTGGTLLYVDDAYTFKPVSPLVIGGPDVRLPPLIVRAGRSTFKVNTAPDAVEQSVKSGFSVLSVPGDAPPDASVETPAGAGAGAGAGAPADVNFPTAGPDTVIDTA